MYKGFSPVFRSDSRILILGSFPSVISRKVDFYYGNPMNRFWKVMSVCFNEIINDTIDGKKDFLLRNNLALWDIISNCEIEGSSDNSIKNYEAADLSVILNNSKIQKILCNGRKAYELTVKIYRDLNIPIIYLPSTSTANTNFDIMLWRNELVVQ